MKVEFRIFHESKKPPNAERAIRAMCNITKARFEINKVEPYLHKGCLAICEATFESQTWEQLIFEILLYAQQFGYSWVISENIEEVLSISTSQFHGGSGVSGADIRIEKGDFELRK